MAHSFTNLIYHIVFSTFKRTPTITTEIEPRLHEYLGGMIKARGGKTIAINGIEDHVHVLARIRQDQAIADFLRDLKSVSSGWVHDTFPQAKRFDWQDGYAAFTVSKSQVDKVAAYIRNQKQHHKKRGFLEELKMLLDAHGIDYDERYL